MVQQLASSPGFEEHIFDFATKYLARDTGEWPGSPARPRHEYYGVASPGRAGNVCESWRFPIVEPHYDAELGAAESARWNQVTFLHAMEREALSVPSVSLVGLPHPELRQVKLSQVSDSIYLAATVLLPAGRAYRYAFNVDGRLEPDSLNPQRARAANGEELSAFFTFACFELVTFEPWEATLLRRLTNHILPFNSREEELFLLRPGGGPKRTLSPQLFRLDHSVGVVNYLDKLLAREERHQLPAYRTCLAQINRLLRSRNPYLEPRDVPKEMFVQLYGEMADGNVPGWDYSAYSNPVYFLFLLRRHTFTGAFCHPKYGGNARAAGWLWIADQFPFAWDRGQERPLGDSAEYRG